MDIRAPMDPKNFFENFFFPICLKTTIWTNLAQKLENQLSESKPLETRHLKWVKKWPGDHKFFCCNDFLVIEGFVIGGLKEA